jgi:hypothetical protein
MGVGVVIGLAPFIPARAPLADYFQVFAKSEDSRANLRSGMQILVDSITVGVFLEGTQDKGSIFFVKIRVLRDMPSCPTVWSNLSD